MQVAGREILFIRCHSEGARRPNESVKEQGIRILRCVQNDNSRICGNDCEDMEATLKFRCHSEGGGRRLTTE